MPETKLLNETTFEIRIVPETLLKLEHSLLSVSKWEALWHEPYIKDRKTLGGKLTQEMLLSYVECMTINGKYPHEVYVAIPPDKMAEIERYINDPMTATTFSDDDQHGPAVAVVLTNEQIYRLMFKNNIPLECERWHLNRLLTLLHVFSAEDNPKKKSQQEIAQERYAKNEYRRQQAEARRKMPRH